MTVEVRARRESRELDGIEHIPICRYPLVVPMIDLARGGRADVAIGGSPTSARLV